MWRFAQNISTNRHMIQDIIVNYWGYLAGVSQVRINVVNDAATVHDSEIRVGLSISCMHPNALHVVSVIGYT